MRPDRTAVRPGRRTLVRGTLRENTFLLGFSKIFAVSLLAVPLLFEHVEKP
jgi:hypothetical protein